MQSSFIADCRGGRELFKRGLIRYLTSDGFQIQMDKEKAVYEVESLQIQVDKALGQCSRVQKEKEVVQNELQKLKDKQDKAQVSL